MLLSILWAVAFLVVPAWLAFSAVLRARGWKRSLLLVAAFVTAWVFLYQFVDARESQSEKQFNRGGMAEPLNTAPGHGEARGYAMICGWMFAGPYVAYLVHLAKLYKSQK